MIKVSSSLPDIAVIRGGNKDFKQSLVDGGEVLKSLSSIGYVPLDVLVDTDGKWTTHGKPTDAHEVFTRAHTVVDTTRMKGEDYQILAKKMGIPLLFSQDDRVCMDREDVYKILKQQGIRVPDTQVIRASAPLQAEQFRKLWSTYHTPLMVQPLERTNEAPSKLIKIFHELEDTVREYYDKGIDMHVLTYRKVPTTSVAVLPNFRGEKLYTPIWVETFSSVNNLPNGESRMQAHTNAPDFRKEQVKKIAREVYDALDLSGPACIDIIPHNDEYVVVNVDTAPSLRKEGRFVQSLKTTGVDVGQYIHSYIQNELTR
ncbi:MAG: hypothetical protein WCT07_02310 [Candidatus Paceibacterota bacterium]|jgi:D-alanine-D-alanine ligase-like ATP-grasp enzyme